MEKSGFSSVGWNDGTAAFVEWTFARSDIAAFQHLTERWSTEAIDKIWASINQRPAAGDEPDPIDILVGQLHDVMPHDYNWMLRSATVKDSVTAFEVYLESAAAEVLHQHGLEWDVRPNRSVQWCRLVPFYERLGVDIETDEVRLIRNLRHTLVHRRGALRTKDDREQYRTHDSLIVNLDLDYVQQSTSVLARTVQAAEREVAPYVFESRRDASLASVKGVRPRMGGHADR
ncbi:hypothetical protein [Rhodococcoides kroppenstedtii]|uniref:hypothetical protein n=1 Tax=Rhodococcoides kroppenstedtii TaxID=293050 RepID=UPI00362C936A